MTKQHPLRWQQLAGAAALFAVACGVLSFPNFTRARSARLQEVALRSVSDMVVIEEGAHAGTVFVADAEAGALFSARAGEGGVAARIPFSDFRPFIAAGAPTRPRALAARGVKLYVADGARSALFEIDVDSRAVRQVGLTAELPSGPASVAVSAEGRLAVAGGARLALANPGGQAEPVAHEFKGLRRVLFSASDLLLLDGGDELLRVGGESRTVTPERLPEEFWDVAGTVSDFVAYRNIYYLAGAGRLVVFAQNKSGVYRRFDRPLTFTPDEAVGSGPSRLYAAAASLFVASDGAATVWRLPRPVPVDVRFEAGAELTSRAAVDLLEYLGAARQLRPRPFNAARDYRSLEELLVEQAVIVSALPEKRAAVWRARLGRIVCGLNPEFCEKRRIPAERVLEAAVRAGETLRLPEAALSEYLTTKRTMLGGRTVSELLRLLFPSAEEREKYAGRERLERLNPPDLKDAAGGGDIFGRKTGNLVLPVKRWQLSLLVSAEDLTSDSSPLRRLQAEHPGLYVLSKQEFASAQAASGAATQAGDDVEQVVANRDLLKKSIGYPECLPDTSQVIIGVGETFESVDFDHPDFVNEQGQSVWVEAGPDAVGVTRHPLAPIPAETLRSIGERFDEANDHGTHVAGLIWTRRDGILPGLLPSVDGLFLVNVSDNNAGDLHNRIQEAVNAGPVRIFNFSLTLPNETLVRVLKNRMQTDWPDSLFVVAAGKAKGTAPEEQELNVSADPPVAWVETVPNMIGVGAVATTPDGEMRWLSPKRVRGDSYPGSKYGKRFLQLAAPGRNIYSLARRHAYKTATGSSQSVPLVTAAAALLYAQKVRSPVRIKARLMYTADWDELLQDRVYAGLLNVGRAVWEPTLNLVTTDPRDGPAAIEFEDDPEVEVSGQLDLHTDERLRPERSFRMRFSKVLRATLQPGDAGYLRVFFLDEKNKLWVVNNARFTDNNRFSGSVKCARMRKWDEEAKEFKQPEPCAPMELSQVTDYVAGVGQVPDDVNF